MRVQNRQSLAGGCLMIGVPGVEIDPETSQKIKKLRPAGLILFRRNLIGFDQTRSLLRQFTELVSRPSLLAIDQEGGRVSRLEGWIGPTVTAHRLAERPEDTVRAFGRTTGLALRCLGLNLDFAPVADLSSAGSKNGIGDRAWSTDPKVVTRMARGFLEGLQGVGVAGCLKHFPGLGDTSADSHLTLPTVPRDRAQLEAEDLLPYRELGALPASVMVGHGHYPAFDGDAPLPATMSARIVRGELRERLGYRGLIVSDDLEMGAIADRDTNGAAAVATLRAGCDLLLYCADLERAARAAAAIAAAAERDPATERRLRDAVARVRAFAEDWPATGSHDRGEWDRRAEAFARFRA